MKKLILAIGLIFIFLFTFVIYAFKPVEADPDLISKSERYYEKYRESFTSDFVIIIDYRLPVFRKRLWLININTNEVILNSHVSHAWKSGTFFPTDFSNKSGSNKSCFGVFATQESYFGDFGYSMRIQGLEKGLNDNARIRAIVFHKSYGPYSDGCFMTFPDVNKLLINLSKNGSLVYVHR